jgi:hypothetical protein
MKKKNKVKMYALVLDGKILDCYNIQQSVFMPRLYKTLEAARNVWRETENEAAQKADIVEVEISF